MAPSATRSSARSPPPLARNVYLDFEVAFPVGGKRELAWAVPPRFTDLRQELDRFLARLRRDGTLARLAERYIPGTRQIQRIDAGVLHERIRTRLPEYQALFHDAQEQTGIEWRLLAAIAYQESQWDPAATSETGVRGLMQITEDTARHLGIGDLLDPAQNVLGAARYLRDLKEKLPARIAEPDRTWLALSAFNIGLGHLEDARILAQKQKLNPDLWSDVKTGAAAPRAARVLRQREAGLCPRGNAGGVRRPRARVLRRPARPAAAAQAALADADRARRLGCREVVHRVRETITDAAGAMRC